MKFFCLLSLYEIHTHMESPLAFKWTESLSVGEETIDQQHRDIFEATNRLLDILIDAEPLEKSYGVLSALDCYIREHLTYEEEYMRRNGYPRQDFDRHVRIHRSFEERFDQFKEKISTQGPTKKLVVEMENYLGTWLLRHIGEEDRRYALFVGSKKP